MQLTAVLFDLDGTLLPMDQDVFVKTYFGLLARKLAPHGYDPETLIGAIWHGTGAMVKNTEDRTNEQAFWDDFAASCGEGVRKDLPLFDAFYREDFAGAKSACGFDPMAAETVALCKQLGLRVVLATNPIFPATATKQRITWAGLRPEDFELYTTYENSCRCKPNPDYYVQILNQLGLKPEECLMVGNDVAEDMVAETLGMRVFLLTNCLINKKNQDISRYPHSGFAELQTFLRQQK